MARCETCSYYDFQGDNKKGYCSWYKAYYYPNDSCSHWKEGSNNSGSGGCFFTSACCSYMGLPDGCQELQVLRKFRDEYLSNSDYGLSLVETYYKDAPDIVNHIEERPDKSSIYEYIYRTISKIVILIESEKNNEAVVEYMLMTYKLSRVTLGNFNPVSEFAY